MARLGELCPKHGRPIDDCQRCEAAIDRAEHGREHDKDWQIGQDRYERWLGGIAP